MHQSTTHLKTCIQLCIVLFAFLAALVYSNETATAWYTSYSANNGFYAWRDIYVGPSTLCPADRIEIEFRLADAETFGPLVSSANLSLRMRYKEPGQNTVFAPWTYPSSGGKSSLCITRDAYSGARIYSNTGSTYVGANTVSNRSSATTTRIAELGSHYVRTIYLARHADPVPTVQPISPIRTVASTTSPFIIRVNEIPAIYGATAVQELWYEFDNLDDGYYTKAEYDISTGIGDYTFTQPSLTDGFYDWYPNVSFNGTKTLTNGHEYSEMPQSNFFQDWFSFVYDATGPVSSLASTVESSNDATQRISLVNTVRDATSGLSSTEIIILNRNTGAETVIAQSFPLAMGQYYGTWVDPQTVSTAVEVSRDYAYELYAVTRDVAGNITESSRTIIPDRNGNTGGSAGSTLVVGLTATPVSVVLGGSSLLSWSINNATACSADWDPGFAFTNGTIGTSSVTPATTTTYTLACSNGIANATRNVTVGVSAVPPVMSLRATSPIIRSGTSASLTWSVTPDTGVNNCNLIGLSSGIAVGAAGSIETDPLTNQRTFTLSCDTLVGPMSESITVRVIPEVYE